MKNLILILLALTLGGLAQAQNVNIPDANLKAALIALYPTVDTSGDGEIQVSEAATYTGLLNLYNKGIADATGLEAFVNTDFIQLGSNSLTTLDISQNTKLRRLYCYENNISSLTLGTIPLTTLYVADNNLSSLSIDHLTSSLEYLSYGGNPMSSSFNFAPFTNLGFLVANDAGLTSIDVSMLSKLQVLSINDNDIVALDLSDNTALYSFSGTGNPSLTCVLVADPAYNWDINAAVDEGVIFTDNCVDPLIVIRDNNLKTALLAHSPDIDTNDDGDIRQSEASAFTGTLSLNSRGIKDPKGLEAFDAAVGLLLQGNVIQRLNVSTNVALTNLDVSNNELKFLNVRNGNQANFISFDATENDNLSCINVDDVSDATTNWTDKPASTTYSLDCEVYIPDANFKTALTTYSPAIDINTDGEIQESEAKNFTGSLIVSSKSIADLTGIGAFYNVTQINCGTNSIATPDFSLNTNMNNLSAIDAGFNSLDLSANKDLIILNVESNNLSALNLNGNPYLKSINVNGNNLSAISILNEEIVTGLQISDNQFSDALDLTSFTALVSLRANQNSGLTSIDVSGLEKLSSIYLSYCNLTSVNFTGTIALQTAWLDNNSLESLDVSDSPNLTNLKVGDNLLTSFNANNGINIPTLSISPNPSLSCVSVFDVDYAEANYSAEFSYDEDCNNPAIDILDSKLQEALLSHTPTIDANGNGKIQEQEAANYTGSLNLSNAGIRNATGIEFFSGATSINLDNNEILSLNLNQNTALTSLSAVNNNMTILQIKNGNNANFTSLNLSGNDGLTCINVDDPTFAAANWAGTPAGAGYSTDCAVNFVAANLKANMIALGHDTNTDTEIQISEAEAVSSSLVITYGLNSMSGIEAFKNCTGLVVSNNPYLVELNLTANTELTSLVAKANGITALDLSLNAKLTNIDVFGNVIGSLDIRNGNNEIITNFEARNNDHYNGPLTCVNVDDVEYFESNFALRVDEGVFYDANCNDPIVDIPDANFLAALTSHNPNIDLNSDGVIRESEAEAFGEAVNVSSRSISDLTGITYFINITGLNVDDNQLTALDVSLNEALTSLSADDNLLTSLNVANRNNESLATFSITGNAGLSCVRVDDPAYSTANWTDHDGVTFGNYCDLDEFVYIPDTQLFLTLSNSDVNTDQKITFGEAQAFTSSVTIYPNVADLTGLEAFINLEGIRYSGSLLTHFDVSQNTGLRSLSIYGSHEVETLDLGTNTSFEILSISDMDLGSIDLSGFSALEELYLTDCNLSSLDVSDATMLTRLNARNNNLTSLDLGSNVLLEDLSIGNNPLTALDLSTNLALTEINISLTGITSIDVTHLADLEDFRVESGSLTTLDLSQNDQLYLLYAGEYDSEGSENEPTTYGALTQVSLPSGSTLDDVDLSANQIHTMAIPALTNASLRLNLDWNGLQTVTMVGTSGNNLEMSLDNNEIESLNVTAVTGSGASVSVKNNHLTQVALGLINMIDLTGNPDLACAQTLDVSYAESTYTYDEGVSFSIDCPETGTDFQTFSLVEQVGEAVIDVSNHTIRVEVAVGTSLTALVPTFTLSAEALSDLASGAAQDFTDPVTYTITAENGLIQAWVVTVSADPNQAPTNIALSVSTLTENNALGDVIGSFTTADTDESDTHTYSLVAGDGDTDNADFEIIGDQLKTKVVFDFELQSSYSIRVQANDGLGGVFSKAFAITITEENGVIAAVDASSQGVQVYPNPTTDWIIVKGDFSSGAVVSLFDLGGNQLLSKPFIGGEKLELQTLEAGIYLLRVSDQKITTTTKILIHR